ncbi:MAG: TRAP transporter substrate-binding protein DctP [Magnetococcales bacterium]|nr:TRAP transporter substrate-binding protein DctP [Magnetococcales bacterium]
MKYLRLPLFVLTLILAPVWASGQETGSVVAEAAPGITVMRVTAVQGADMTYVGLLEQLKQNIQNRSHGEIQVELLTGGAGGGEFEALRDQIRGHVEGGWISAMTLAQSLKAFRALTLPLVFNDNDQLRQFIGSPLDKTIRATSVAKNLLILGYGSFGYYGIMLFEPGSPPNGQSHDDALAMMKDRTVRVPEEEWLESVQAVLPGKLVRVPGVDLKKAVDSGWVKGLLTTPELIANKEWMLQASHFLNLRHLHAWTVFSVNRTWLASLPGHLQDVVQAEVQAMCDQALQMGLARHDALVAKWYETRHPQVVQASWDEMAASMNPLVLETASQLDGMLGSSGRVKALWEANYQTIKPPGRPTRNRGASPLIGKATNQRREMARAMIMNRIDGPEWP